MITLHQSYAATLQALFSSVASLEALSKNSTLIFLQLLMRLVSSAQACILILNPFHKIIVVLIVNLPLHHHLQSVLYITQTETLLSRHSTPRKRAGWDAARAESWEELSRSAMGRGQIFDSNEKGMGL